MQKLRIIVFASLLHDRSSVMDSRQELFDALRRKADIELDYPANLASKGEQEDESQDVATLCFIATGGTEEMFRPYVKVLPKPIYILSDGYHNSFAASFEIATYLDRMGLENHLFNVPLDCNDAFIENMCSTISKGGAAIEQDTSRKEPSFTKNALHALARSRIGLIGGESSWLIASSIDEKAVSDRWGAQFVHIDINEVNEGFGNTSDENAAITHNIARFRPYLSPDRDEDELKKALKIYSVLKDICIKYGLNAITVKCFDILDSCRSTACLALAMLNDEGIIAGCEGDIPSLWSMLAVYLSSGKRSFMANPSSSNRKELTVDFAHCTIPLSMLHGYRLPTHFESSTGIAVKGSVPSGRYRIVKFSGKALDKVYTVDGDVIMNTNIAQRCRTQIRFRFDSEPDYDAFIAHRSANHCIIYSIG